MIQSEENSTVSIPAEFDDPEATRNGDSVDGIFDRHLYSFENYKSDRDTANDYE
jgi:hypothetical protein